MLGRALGLGAVAHLLVVPAGPAAAAAGVPPVKHDLTVFVVSRALAPTEVALSYSRVVEEARLRAGIGTLGERTGATVAEVRVQTGPLRRDLAELATGAQFLAPGLIKAETGLLPVGAIVRSLPDWEHMRIVFVLDEGFEFAGPRDAAADGFVVRLASQMAAQEHGVEGQMAAYEYDVERMSGGLRPAGEGVPSEERRVPVLPAIAIAVPPGLLLGWLLADRRGRGAGA